MNAELHDSEFDRWWWRAWYVYFALALVWLSWCAWLARPIAPWAQGWVGWWTGDQMGSRPLWNFHVHTGFGAEIIRGDGNPVFHNANAAFTDLGRWGEDGETWTWAGWVKVTPPNGVWPTNLLVLRSARAPGFDFRLGFEAGRPAFTLTVVNASRDPRYPLSYTHQVAKNLVQVGEWTHLAFSADRQLLRIVINGVPVMEDRRYMEEVIRLAELRLTCQIFDAQTQIDLQTVCAVEQDDVAVFDRVVPPEELAALASRGRGAWAPEVERSTHAAQVWGHGWPLALLVLTILLLLKRLPGAHDWLTHGLSTLLKPSFRTIRWTLAAGGLISVVLTGSMARQGRRADEQHFDELLRRFKQDTSTEWGQLAALLLRAKDWIAVQTNLNQESWEVWLHANRFPFDYPGAIGIGYAQQVLPGQVAAHEAEWSAKHGFDYRVHPPFSAQRQPVIELEGNPQLPVVLYCPGRLDPRLWFTNHTILGRDLLFQSQGDRRTWAEARRVEEVAARNEMQTSSLEEIAPAEWYGTALQGLRLYMPWTLVNKRDDAKYVLPSSAWHGVVFASVDVTRELGDRFASGASPIGFRLYTGTPLGERLDLVADSANFLANTADRPNAYLRRTIEITSYYRRLFLDAWTTQTFERQSMLRWPWIAGGAGGAFTLLAATLLFVQVRAREAQALVLEELRLANSKLLVAYREREDLSRDLHDGSIQNLYGLGLHLQRVKTLLTTSPERAHAELDDSLVMLDQSIAELRQFILSAGVDHLPLHTVTSAIEGLFERLRKTTQIDLRLHLDEQAVALDPSAGVHVLHIVREAVSNSLRHAEATQIEVRLERVQGETEDQPEYWRLGVVDDGCGFDVNRVNGDGRGLKNLASRAAELGGSSEARSTPGAGTRILVEFPDRQESLHLL